MKAHVLRKNSAPPQRFNGPLLPNVYKNSDGKLSGTLLASVAGSMIQWHMPKMGPCLIITNACKTSAAVC